MLGKSITKNSAILAAFAALTAGTIAFIYQATAARIAEAERRAAQRALFEIVPRERHDNDLLEDTLLLSDAESRALGLNGEAQVHIARRQGAPVAFIVPAVAPDGYSGAIRLLVGVNVDGSVAGVRVVSHRETPGLGDKIELQKSAWILGFDGKTLQFPPVERWRVKKDGGDFDQFAGATITPRAVISRVRTVLEQVQHHQARWQTPVEPTQLQEASP